MRNWTMLLFLVGWATALWFFSMRPLFNLEMRTSVAESSLRFEMQRGQLLNDEISELRSRPTYEDGYRDAVIRAGAPENASTYKDGYEAALLVVGDATYAEGYHAAIKQFGFPARPNQAIAKARKENGQ
jgi:hypothetical protein